MKCSKCGLENRPNARFCKQCGEALRAPQATPPTIPTNICPACGATAKPQARFCPRCGKPLPSDPTRPSSPVTDTAPPPSSITQPYTTPPPPTSPITHTQPWAAPPPPAPATPNRPFPRWAGCAVVVIVFICAAILVVIAIKFGPELLKGNIPL